MSFPAMYAACNDLPLGGNGNILEIMALMFSNMFLAYCIC